MTPSRECRDDAGPFRLAMRPLRLASVAVALLAAACTCRQPDRVEPRDAGPAPAADRDAASFGCADAETHLTHTVGVVEATLGECTGDGDCVGDHLLVDCPQATFVTCGFAYAGAHEVEARARIDDAVDTACARLDEPCEVRALDAPDCPPAVVRCVDGRCRVVAAPR